MEENELTPLQEKAIAGEIEEAYKKGRIHGLLKIGVQYIEEISQEDTEFSLDFYQSEFVINESYGKINNEIIELYIKTREDFILQCTGNLFTQKYVEEQVKKAYLEGQLYGVKSVYEGLDEEYCKVTKEDYRENFILFLKSALKYPKSYPEENEKFKI